MTEHSSHAELDWSHRLRKAEKIHKLLRLPAAQARRLQLLEIGTGSGAIAHYFAKLESDLFGVFAVDVVDQRMVKDGYEFQVYDGVRLPFTSAIFDLVITNHVIEHIGDRRLQAAHLAEIERVLKPGGRAYLASPNRWQFIEPHFRLPGLSWLPRPWRDAYVRLTGRGKRYDCDPMTHVELEEMLRAAGLRFRNINVAALRATLQLEGGSQAVATVLRRIPDSLLQCACRLSPTMVYLLEKESAAESGKRQLL